MKYSNTEQRAFAGSTKGGSNFSLPPNLYCSKTIQKFLLLQRNSALRGQIEAGEQPTRGKATWIRNMHTCLQTRPEYYLKVQVLPRLGSSVLENCPLCHTQQENQDETGNNSTYDKTNGRDICSQMKSNNIKTQPGLEDDFGKWEPPLGKYFWPTFPQL